MGARAIAIAIEAAPARVIETTPARFQSSDSSHLLLVSRAKVTSGRPWRDFLIPFLATCLVTPANLVPSARRYSDRSTTCSAWIRRIRQINSCTADPRDPDPRNFPRGNPEERLLREKTFASHFRADISDSLSIG